VHELAIARDLIDMTRRHVPEERLAQVEVVRLRVGSLAGVVESSLLFCFEALVRGTALDSARLEIDAIPIRARCADCQTDFELPGSLFQCPDCGGGALALLSGNELDLQEIVLADLAPEAT